MLRYLKHATISCLALATCSATALAAEIYASAPVSNGPSATSGTIYCQVFNAGNADAQIYLLRIIRSPNFTTTITQNTCGSVLTPNEICVFSAPISGVASFACKFYINESTAEVRGVAKARNQNGLLIETAPIEK